MGGGGSTVGSDDGLSEQDPDLVALRARVEARRRALATAKPPHRRAWVQAVIDWWAHWRDA